jgi:hypothetical protein
MTESEADVRLPPGLIDAVLHLVRTGPVLLGGLQPRRDNGRRCRRRIPRSDAVGGGGCRGRVRSLAARQLLVASPETERLQVRGDPGIAVVFQQRARDPSSMLALAPSRESRSRTLLLPQPEGVALEVLIEAIGAPELSLREIDEALRRLRGKLRR